MDVNSNTLSSALLQSMEQFKAAAVGSSNGTLTVEAKVVEVIDEGKGIYKVEYLGNAFEAAAASNEIIYDIDEMVYVIVPNGDFDKNKIILSPVSPTTTTYADTVESNKYFPLGNNLFSSVDNVELCTFRPEEKSVMIDKTGFKDLIASYLKDTKIFNFTCRVKTNIDKSRRTKGNYGLVLSIPIKQENENKNYKVTLDINNFQGDLYNFSEYALQKCYFTLPEDCEYNAEGNLTISAFVEGFPGGYKAAAPADIWIKNIELIPCAGAGEDFKSGYYLFLSATEGASYLPSRTSDIKIITPTVYLNGRVTNLKNFDCYWFKENYLIDALSNKYHRLGGFGWEILNDRQDVAISEDGKETYQYVTNNYSQTVSVNEVRYFTKYKCVLVKGDIVISQDITLKNLASAADIQLLSATGTNYYTEGLGRVHLIVRYYENNITNLDSSLVNVNYAWQRYDKLGNYIGNDFYTVDRINEKKTIGDKVYYETEISYNVSDIDTSNIIYCTVYLEANNNGVLYHSIVGTDSIMISTSATPSYIIKINNGDKLFKYDADGDSPKVANYDGPLSSVIKNIEPISVNLYKPDGSEFTSGEYAATTLEWLVPINSMININSSLKYDTNSNEGYYTIKGNYDSYNSLPYDIARTYNKKKLNNTIIIKAYLRDKKAEGTANLRFLKDGESGTNGAKYSAIITYGGLGYGEKAANGKDNKLQLIYIVDEDRWYRYNSSEGNLAWIEAGTSFADMGVDLYGDGEKVSNPNVTWSIFDSNYTYDKIKCPFTVNTNGQLLIRTEAEYKWTDSTANFCGTIQARVRAKKTGGDDGITGTEEYVYAYYPVEMTRVMKRAYLASLYPTMEGGYDQVVYASDGTNPQYDNSTNFRVGNFYNNNLETTMYNYTWSSSSNLAIRTQTEPADKTCKATPVTKFDNGNSKNYIRSELVAVNSASSDIQREKAELNVQLTSETNRKNYFVNVQNALDILNNFRYNYYKEELNKTSKLFKLKSELNNLYKELIIDLGQLKDLCNTYKAKSAYINNTILTSSAQIDNINALLSFVQQLGIQEQIIDTIKNIIPNELLLEEINVKPQDDVAVTTVNDRIKKYNAKINSVYTNYYNQLDSIVGMETQTINIIGTIQNYCLNSKWEILSSEGEKQYLFNGLVDVLHGYINAFSNEENYSIDKIIENILNPIKNSIDSLKDLDYTSTILSIQNNVDSLTEKLSELDIAELSYEAKAFVHIKPIIMIYNRYEMSNINGWDGNKTEVQDGYILSPQFGAGKKENGQFTGVVMGVKQAQVNSSTNQKVGLFGFSAGIQSFFLNARDGSATFGKSGGGQIIIDPNNNQAIIKSGNYSTSAGTGMQINLSEPEIRFGSGNFIVDKDGKLKAENGYFKGEIQATSGKFSGEIQASKGTIGGWSITSNELYSSSLTLDSYGSIYSGSHQYYNSTNGGFHLSSSGLSIGSLFRVNSSGYLTATNGSFSGSISANSGDIGGWTISSGSLSSGKITLNGFSSSITGTGFTLDSSGLTCTSGTFTNCTFDTGTIKNKCIFHSINGKEVTIGTNDVNESAVAIAYNGGHSKIALSQEQLWFKAGTSEKAFTFNGEAVVPGSEVSITLGTSLQAWSAVYATEYYQGTTKIDFTKVPSHTHNVTEVTDGQTGWTHRATTVAVCDGRYALQSHTHSGYAASSHSHDARDLPANTITSLVYSGWDGNLSDGDYVVTSLTNSGHKLMYSRKSYKPSSSSDKRLKNNINKIDINSIKNFYNNINPVSFKFKEGATNNNPKELNFGVLAQELDKNAKDNLTDESLNLVYKDYEASEKQKKVVKDDYVYKVNYDQFHAFHIVMIQDLMKRVETLEQELKELKGEK